MRTIIAGSRTIEAYNVVSKILDKCPFKITEVVCGKARGVDTLGEIWGKSKGIPIKYFPAPWSDIKDRPANEIGYNDYGAYWKLAGFVRNREMAEYANALVLIWDGESNGAGNMKELAHENKLKIYEVVL